MRSAPAMHCLPMRRLSLLVDPSEVAASVLGSLSAALECEAEGNIPIGPEDVLGKLQGVEKRVRFV